MIKRILGILVVTTAAASLSFAQDRTPSADSEPANRPAATQNADDGTRNHNWGWIGLLGLAGLGGLRGRRPHTTDRDRDVNNIRRAA
jgi:hypothetical protein